LLNVIHPKQGGEERWIRDTLGIVKLKINLSKYTIPPEDAIDYFIRTQYKGIRCRLFHAKHPYALLPHEELNPVDVLNAYELLISLWHEIAEAFFQLPRGGSGFTYQGFKWLADNLFAKSFYLVFSNDATPPNKDDTITTLSNINDVVFDKSSYDGQVKPDVFRWQATKYLYNSININYVFKICTIVDSKLFNIAYIPNGLSLHGVYTFNTQQNLRFVNKGQPKTTF
jgi:hypothetical protein